MTSTSREARRSNSGGLQVVEPTGAASGTVVSGAGAELLVAGGAVVSGTILSGGGFDEIFGTAVSTPPHGPASAGDASASNGWQRLDSDWGSSALTTV